VSRNVVLVTYDSLRADHCGYMGYGRDTTPTLDRLAGDGLVFENAVASGVPTIASMTSVMTGRHSLASPEVGRTDEQREQVTSRPKLAEVLSREGYSTGAMSPNPPASSYFGFDEGFDWFEDFLDRDEGLVERAWNRVFRRSIEGGGLSTYLRLARNVVTKNEILRPWEDFYDRILSWRERVEEPYFLWVLLLEPHHPWVPPTDEQRWSSRRDKYVAFRQYFEMFNNGWEPDFSPRERQRLIDLYDDSTRYGDRFLDRLGRDLAEDDPVLVVHADHGEEFGAHGRYGHQPYLYEDLIHVPLVVSNAGREGRVERPVGLRSIAPTVADLAGADHSFPAPSLFEESDPWVTSKVFAEGTRRAAVRTARAKYLEGDSGGELYDLASDPDEQRNRVDDEAEAAAEFAGLLAYDRHAEAESRTIDDAADELAAGGSL
jgi:arylsulfatase